MSRDAETLCVREREISRDADKDIDIGGQTETENEAGSYRMRQAVTE
jgi:hypothetical protein